MGLRIGLAVGRGTGAELAAVFERTWDRLGQLYSTRIDITRSPRVYHSYSSLIAEGGIDRIRRLTQEDAEHYEQFCRTQAALGTPAVFRTAMNAQSLYLVRQRLQAVKVDLEILRFMSVVYGARITTHDYPHPWSSQLAEGEKTWVAHGTGTPEWKRASD